jgi:hypothetical protein
LESDYQSKIAVALGQTIKDLIERESFAHAMRLLIDHISVILQNVDPLSNPARNLLSSCLILQHPLPLSKMMATLFCYPGLTADFYDSPANDPAVARIEFLGSGELRVLFLSLLLGLTPQDQARPSAPSRPML